MDGNSRKHIPHAVRVAVFLVILALLVFRQGLSGGTLFTTDDNIGHLASRSATLPGAFLGGWSDSPLAGMPATLGLAWTNLLLWLLPVRFVANWLHALGLTLGSLFLFGYLLQRRLHPFAALLGSLTAFWLGTNFTLLYAGHVGKFAIMLLAAAALYCIEKTAQTRRMGWALLAGGATGGMFIEQQDVALFVSMLVGPYLLFALWREQRQRWISAWIRLGLPMVAVAFLVAAHSLLGGYREAIQGVSVLQESREQRWEFCTQWSWPPEESIDFIAPGFTGWRSGEPAGPYWGRMGRSGEWDRTRQGFMNFKLENTYLGVLPVVFALFALLQGCLSRRRADIVFWASATMLALLLAFGKHFPLYQVFWQLPVVNSIRNPNKFLHVFQLGLGVLAAYGMDALFGEAPDTGSLATGARTRAAASGSRPGGLGWCVGGIATAGVLLGLAAMAVSLGQSGIAAGFAGQGWPADMARVIAANQSAALWHAVIMAVLATAVFAVFAFPKLAGWRRFRLRIAAGLVLVVAADSVWLSRHYVKTLPAGYIEENDVARLLTSTFGRPRIALATHESFYNIWLTYLFPHHRIPAFNITQMPRMPEDYRRFLETVGRNPLRMWQLAGVEYLLGPAGLEKQLPEGTFKTVFRYEVLAGRDEGFRVQADAGGSQYVFRSLVPAPRYAVIGGSVRMEDGAALARLASPGWVPFGKVILPPGDRVGGLDGSGIVGQVDVVDYRPGRIRLRVRSDAPGFLRVADRYDPGWTATINGDPAVVLRADYLFQAVPVPAGDHEVELAYRPGGNWTLWLQFAGMAVCLSALAALTLPFLWRGKETHEA